MNEIILRYEPGNEWLAHHGILGQKWGVRRFQNKDMSLTPAGRRRYGVSKSDVRQNIVNLTSRQRKYAEEYKKKGMSDSEAAKAAYNRDRIQKALIAVGGVTLTAAVAYGAYKYKDYVSDEIIRSGTKAYRISPTSTAGVHDGFYAAFSKKDANKYVGLYGKHLSVRPNVYQKQINVVKDMKIASDKSAHNVFKQHFEKLNPDERSEVIEFIKYNKRPFEELSPTGKIKLKALSDLKRGDVTKDAYEAFNISMTNHTSNPVVSKFVDELKRQGYSGIKDVNDRKYSGYNAKTSKIIFDSSKVAVESVRDVPMSEIYKKAKREETSQLVKSLPLLGGSIGAYYTAYKSIDMTDKTADRNRIVQEYKKEHPNSKLTYKEIVNNYYRNGDSK